MPIAAPRIFTREEWGARPPSGPYSGITPSGIIFHHTYSPGNGPMTMEEECASMRSMQAHHMSRGFGATDIAQHYTVFQSGRIYAGRPDDVRGAHAPAANAWAIGIEHQGDFTETAPTDLQWKASTHLFAWICERYNLSPRNAILGHRDVTSTACPGNTMYALLPSFRDDVANFRGATAVVGRGWIAALDG